VLCEAEDHVSILISGGFRCGDYLDGSMVFNSRLKEFHESEVETLDSLAEEEE